MTEKEFVALLRPVVEAWQELKEMVDNYKPPVPTIESVYGKPLSELKPPAGYRFKLAHRISPEGQIMNIIEPSFLPPLKGEWFLTPDGKAFQCCMDDKRNPRLILVKCKRLVFDVLDERSAKDGELWASKANPAAIYEYQGHGCSFGYILSEPRVEE